MERRCIGGASKRTGLRKGKRKLQRTRVAKR